MKKKVISRLFWSNFFCCSQVYKLNGIKPLIELFTSQHPEVQQYSTGAARNLLYENMDNKVTFIECDGIDKILNILKVDDDELQKNITGKYNCYHLHCFMVFRIYFCRILYS